VEGVLWYKRVLPVGLAYAGTLAFGNTVYLFLNVGFIQVNQLLNHLESSRKINTRKPF
jgi:hypothetical protein